MKFFPLVLVVVLLSCTGNEDRTTNHTSGAQPKKQQQAKAAVDVSGCYVRVIQRDTLAASLQQSGSRVTGKLSFDNFEKDGSAGLVSGTIDGDKVKLTYHFQSEGTESEMEVYFKIAGSDLIHGVGDMSGEGKYVNEAGISYPETNRLKKVSCTALPANYK